MDKAKIIRQSVTMREMAECYGFVIDGKGFIQCPFHGEKTSSLKIYEDFRGFACFGCDVSGSVIDFAMNLFRINFKDAVIRISNDFNLGLTKQRPDKKQIELLRQRQQQRLKENSVKRLIKEFYLLDYKISERIKDTIHPSKELTKEQAEAIVNSTNAENWLLNNL